MKYCKNCKHYNVELSYYPVCDKYRDFIGNYLSPSNARTNECGIGPAKGFEKIPTPVRGVKEGIELSWWGRIKEWI